MIEVIKSFLPLDSVIAFWVYIVCAVVALGIVTWVYTLITPHNEMKLIRAGNVSAAIAMSGTVIGLAIPFQSIISHSYNPVDFLLWAVLAAIVQLGVFRICTIFLKGASAKIEDDNIAAGIFCGGMAIAVGLINAACMTPS
ncbi:putative membrane protein [Pseudomonas nitritireducens]|uniref:Putative membrane protein n=1 Tax=Pseudomonas nitroreducens TaxID=46680 RepID=A0A7W7P3B7_PSENT|nr:DUF350 domain-containing protein [Pseudomonas nitritireducens]MBB4866813.1 putative membrane protein [Pseudomonas nitritireducens]